MVTNKSKSEINLTTIQLYNKPGKIIKKSLDKKDNVAKMNSLVKSLENTLYESQRSNKLKTNENNNKNKDDEARKENKQLLNVLQQQCSNHDLGNPRSQVDLSPSYSTVSMVHLQYKYEELLSSHEGLLKLLEAKVREVRKCYSENEALQTEIKHHKTHHDETQRTISLVCDKYVAMKGRKERKISRLKFERDTVKLAHDKMVHLLHKKCMEHDFILGEQLGVSTNCLKSMLINEIRRANKLQYENVILHQRNCYLQARIGQNVFITNTLD